jgi:hypothetical protein
LDGGNNHGDSSISGGDGVSQREGIAETVIGQVWGENKSLPSFVYGHEGGGGSQRSNVAGSPGEVVQVMVTELPERTWVVGWLSCRAEITGRTRRSAL